MELAEGIFRALHVLMQLREIAREAQKHLLIAQRKLRRRRAAAAAAEKLDAELLLHLGDIVAHRLLGQEQHRGCVREIPRLAQRQKAADHHFVQHAWSPPSSKLSAGRISPSPRGPLA